MLGSRGRWPLLALVAALLSSALPLVPAWGANNTIELLTVPTSSTPGSELTFTWTVTGTGNITHTAVHWSPFPADPTDYASYVYSTSDYVHLEAPDVAPHTYTVRMKAPIQLTWTPSGTMYYIVHALVDGQHVYASGGERIVVIEGAAPIEIRSAPTSARAGEPLTFTWEVTGSGLIRRTALHWDTKPGNPSDPSSYRQVTPDFLTLEPPHQAPRTYAATLEAPASGPIFYVVEAVVGSELIVAPGGERTVQVTGSPAVGLATVLTVVGVAAAAAVAVGGLGVVLRRRRRIDPRLRRSRE